MAPVINPSLSPDGKMLAANRIDPTTGNWDVWLVDLVSGRARRATTQPGIDSDAVWSPDGRQIAYASSRGEGKGIYSIDLASGAETHLYTCRERCWWMTPSAWTPDGRFVLFNTDFGRIETVAGARRCRTAAAADQGTFRSSVARRRLGRLCRSGQPGRTTSSCSPFQVPVLASR